MKGPIGHGLDVGCGAAQDEAQRLAFCRGVPQKASPLPRWSNSRPANPIVFGGLCRSIFSHVAASRMLGTAAPRDRHTGTYETTNQTREDGTV